MFHRFLIATALIFSVPSILSQAHAGYDHPLERISRDYREAVKDFERYVERLPGFDRSDEELADDLEDASGRLKSAVKRLDRPERLYKAWQEVSFYHHKVGNHFFANPYCRRPVGPLWRVWNRADYLYNQLAQRMHGLHLTNPVVLPHHAYRGQDLNTRQHLYRSRSFNGIKIGANLSRKFD